MQTAIHSTAQQRCASAHGVPKGAGLFSKLDLIQVRTLMPRLASDLSLPSASAHGAWVVSCPIRSSLHGCMAPARVR
ncbi:hypothetical protein J1605_020040 [Eschrichtius robustus]|uniref:Uncharacterized protein n=1 Tax=Eschrichtius robustus TaxID=9764 RepID=A0AB34HKT0_ESCRO|nr:hypothetical protein J1605_020040 [Eschrichtius robustus]